MRQRSRRTLAAVVAQAVCAILLIATPFALSESLWPVSAGLNYVANLWFFWLGFQYQYRAVAMWRGERTSPRVWNPGSTLLWALAALATLALIWWVVTPAQLTLWGWLAFVVAVPILGYTVLSSAQRWLTER